MNKSDELRDAVAYLPYELARIEQETGKLPDEVKLEPGFFCKWGERGFIHARAVLPLNAIEKGIGFGLWVEVSLDDLKTYLDAESDEDYMKFVVEGKLANQWPGFQNMLGVRVKLRAINPNEKVYIREVYSDITRDALFEVAVRTAADDERGIENIKSLVTAYMADMEEMKRNRVKKAD
jgi:hypothetical protein